MVDIKLFGKRNFTPYWANTSFNSLVGKLVREGNRKVKEKFETSLRGKTIRMPIDEQIVYNELDHNEDVVFSLLLASGYLKVLSYDRMELLVTGQDWYSIISNRETSTIRLELRNLG